jgi:hypothetical protein
VFVNVNHQVHQLFFLFRNQRMIFVWISLYEFIFRSKKKN